MFAKLTETSPGVFSLPVTRTVIRLHGVTETTPEGKRVSIDRLLPADRPALGWYELIEDSFTSTFQSPGVPLDTVTDTEVLRSFPNPVSLEITTLYATRQADLEFLRTRLLGLGVAAGAVQARTDLEGLTEALSMLVASQRPAPPVLHTYMSLTGIKVITASGVLPLVTAVQDYRQDVEENFATHLMALGALTDPEDLGSYDLTTGWPTGVGS